jgi:hypothetical protein
MKKSKKEDLSAILDLIVDDVAVMVKNEQEGSSKLSKADPGQESPGEKKPEGSSIEGTDDSEASAETSPPPADESAGAPPAEGSAPPAGPTDGAPPEGSPSGDPAADASQGLTPETIKAEIEHLPVDQVKMYYLAFKARLMELLPQDGGDAGAGMAPPSADPAAAAGAPPSAPPPAAAPPEASAPPMGKGEFDDESGKISKSEVSLFKSEMISLRETVETLKKSLSEKDATIAAFEENVGKVAKALHTKLNKQQGMRKSLAGVSFVERPGTESPSADKAKIDGVLKLPATEITKRLTVVTASPDLAKSDRDKISGYYAGRVKLENIAHLITE